MARIKRTFGRVWRFWEATDSVKSLWELIPVQHRKKVVGAMLTLLIAGPLAGWRASAETWWQNNWGAVAIGASIGVGSALLVVILLTLIDRRGRTDQLAPNPPSPGSAVTETEPSETTVREMMRNKLDIRYSNIRVDFGSQWRLDFLITAKNTAPFDIHTTTRTDGYLRSPQLGELRTHWEVGRVNISEDHEVVLSVSWNLSRDVAKDMARYIVDGKEIEFDFRLMQIEVEAQTNTNEKVTLFRPLDIRTTVPVCITNDGNWANLLTPPPRSMGLSGSLQAVVMRAEDTPAVDEVMFKTEGEMNRVISGPKGKAIRSVRLVPFDHRVLGKADLPVDIQCGTAQITIKKIMPTGILIDELGETDVEIRAELYYEPDVSGN